MVGIKKFLSQTDYDILYKASRMDIELLKNEININAASFEQNHK